MPKQAQDPLKALLEEETLPSNLVPTDEAGEAIAPLTLQELFEERKLQFNLGGKMIDFRDPNKISTQDSARMMKMEKMFRGALDRIEKNPEDEDAVRRFDRIVSAFVKFILPEIPDDILEPLDYMKKSRILQYWFDYSGFGKKKGNGAKPLQG